MLTNCVIILYEHNLLTPLFSLLGQEFWCAKKLGKTYRCKSDSGNVSQQPDTKSRTAGGNECSEAGRRDVLDRNASEGIQPRKLIR